MLFRSKPQIWILRDGKPVPVPVVAGLDDDSFTEIASGDVKPGDLVITAEQLAATGKAVTPRLGPVSYTHLDVYKRQALDRYDAAWPLPRIIRPP